MCVLSYKRNYSRIHHFPFKKTCAVPEHQGVEQNLESDKTQNRGVQDSAFMVGNNSNDMSGLFLGPYLSANVLEFD